MLTPRIELVQIPAIPDTNGNRWKIRALSIDGRSLALAALVEWEKKEPQNFKKIIISLKMAAKEVRVINPRWVKKCSNRKLGDVYEALAFSLEARMIFFIRNQSARSFARTVTGSRKETRMLRLEPATHLKLISKPIMPPNPKLPKNLADLFAETPQVSSDDLEQLKRAGENIEGDPALQSVLLKGLFVNAIMHALKDEKLTKSDVARRMNCTRQNLTQLLDEERSGNFTIDTLTSIAAAANRRVEIQVLSKHEIAYVRRVFDKTDSGDFRKVEVMTSENYCSSPVAANVIRPECFFQLPGRKSTASYAANVPSIRASK